MTRSLETSRRWVESRNQWIDHAKRALELGDDAMFRRAMRRAARNHARAIAHRVKA